LCNADLDVDPIFGRAVVEVLYAIGTKPLMYGVQRFVLGLDERSDFIQAKVLAITRVVGVRDWYKS
jgi:hypothetical protein